MWQEDRSIPNAKCFQQMYQPFCNSHHSLGTGWEKSMWNISSSILPAEAESQSTLIITTFRELWWFMEQSLQLLCPFSKVPRYSTIFRGNFLILKAVFLFPSEQEWLWSVASWRIGRWTRYLHKEIWEVLKKTALAPQIPVCTTEFASAWDTYALF